jgi:hypothetical protein
MATGNDTTDRPGPPVSRLYDDRPEETLLNVDAVLALLAECLCDVPSSSAKVIDGREAYGLSLLVAGLRDALQYEAAHHPGGRKGDAKRNVVGIASAAETSY